MILWYSLYDFDRFMEGPHPCVLDVLYEPYYVLLVQNPNPLKLGAEELWEEASQKSGTAEHPTCICASSQKKASVKSVENMSSCFTFSSKWVDVMDDGQCLGQ